MIQNISQLHSASRSAEASDTTYIVSKPISNVTYTTIVDAFDKVFVELTEQKFKPMIFFIIENQAIGPLKLYTQNHDCTL